MVVHTSNPSTQKAEAGALQVQCQLGIHDTPFQKNTCVCVCVRVCVFFLNINYRKKWKLSYF
jgi:hypothetical protein